MNSVKHIERSKEYTKTMKIIKRILISSPLSVLFAPTTTFAQDPPPVPFVINLTTPMGIFDFLCKVLFGWLFYLLIILVIFFVLLAAYKYLTAGGDPEKVKTASNVLIFAAIAVVIALLARGLPLIITTLFGTSLFYSC